MYLDQVGVHALSTPTPPEEGLGRQNIDTNVVTIASTAIAIDAHLHGRRPPPQPSPSISISMVVVMTLPHGSSA